MILFSRPDYESVTKYLSALAKQLIREAAWKVIDVVDLFGRKANKIELEGRLKKMQPSLVVLTGHGGEDFVTGQDDEILVRAGVNSEILSGMITYAVSCQSAERLGQEVGSYPDTCYIGYEKKFSFLHSHGYFQNPEADPVALPFIEFSNQIVRSLLKGHSTHESVERAKNVGQNYLQELESSLSDPDKRMSAALLWRDISCLVACGDDEKKI